MSTDPQSFAIFHPHLIERAKKVDRFAYYTRAETALSILQNETMWMRKTSCMNDTQELAFGRECITNQLISKQESIAKALDEIYPGLAQDVREDFNNDSLASISQTYIMCVSEHAKTEDTLGRLSMWRAYGGTTGVAIVFKKEAAGLVGLPYYASPVLYTDSGAFGAEFDKVMSGLHRNRSFLQSLGRDDLRQYMRFALQSAMASIKHRGFEEEKEWRVIYCPLQPHDVSLTPTVKSVGGVPQLIYEIDFRSSINPTFLSLIDRIIIGPTQYPEEIAEALTVILQRKAADRIPIVISDIPLRHNA